MNGSENGYAGALFFALISLGALLKVDDVVGWLIGAICALASAVCLRTALVKSAQAQEEDHQRVEIQFQQLRDKVGKSSSVGEEALRSIIDVAQIIQEDLQVIRVRLAELNNLSKLAENSSALRSTVAALDENSSALNAGLEKILLAVQAQNSSAVADELKKIRTVVETNKSNLQTVAKLVQVVGQMLKTSPYTKELEKISATLDTLAEKFTDFDTPLEESSPEGLSDFNRQDLSLRKKIAAKLKRK